VQHERQRPTEGHPANTRLSPAHTHAFLACL